MSPENAQEVYEAYKKAVGAALGFAKIAISSLLGLTVVVGIYTSQLVKKAWWSVSKMQK